MSGVNRRTFLASAGSGAAALALGSPARALGPNDQIRIAVIGFHGRGKSHIAAFAKDKRTTVATLCDVDSRLFKATSALVGVAEGKSPECVQDLRRVLDDKDIDAVSIATPNHWHSLATVWACQAGKDVYVEKPVSHNFFEGRKMVEAARKYGRVVQTGTQSRSSKGVAGAVEFLRSGGIGDVYLAKGLCYKPRGSIGHKADGTVPAGVDYSLWLGPAPSGRSTRTGSTTSGTGTGTTAVAISRTRASTRWTSPVGASARRPGPRRSSAPAAGSATRTTARPPTPS